MLPTMVTKDVIAPRPREWLRNARRPTVANPHFLKKWRLESSISRQKTIIETHKGKGPSEAADNPDCV
jgi:hypothetical protein